MQSYKKIISKICFKILDWSISEKKYTVGIAQCDLKKGEMISIESLSQSK